MLKVEIGYLKRTAYETKPRPLLSALRQMFAELVEGQDCPEIARSAVILTDC